MKGKLLGPEIQVIMNFAIILVDNAAFGIFLWLYYHACGFWNKRSEKDYD